MKEAAPCVAVGVTVYSQLSPVWVAEARLFTVAFPLAQVKVKLPSMT